MRVTSGAAGTEAASAPASERSDDIKAFQFQVFSQLQGALTAAQIYIGDRLGLYRALAEAGRAVEPAELAGATGLDERWVREWCCQQAAAKLVAYEDGRFGLSPEGVAVLADEDSAVFGAGSFRQFTAMMRLVERLPESFRTGMGYDYDTGGPDKAAGIEASFAPWYRHALVSVVLPLLGVSDRLRDGAVAIDVGCGAGRAVLTMAEAFPGSTFVGYDVSRHALERAEAARRAAGLDNARFVDARTEPLPSDHSAALVTVFDVLHDVPDPAGLVAAVRGAIADDGVWLLVDIKARESVEENLRRNPMAALMYGSSLVTCLPSALSEPGGAGLGTLGLPPSAARRMAEEAGFTQFRTLDVQHPINAFYEIRP